MLIHVYVSGRVQGVGYRAWCVRMAYKYALSGWVRNRMNGFVELLAEGEKNNVESFLAECHRGPLCADVCSVTPVNIPDAVLYPIESGLFLQKPTV